MAWVIDEDFALKQKLSGMSVYNYGQSVTVPVATYFRFPDPEERQRTFPHIAIDLVSIDFDPTRAHRADGPILDFDFPQATPASGFTFVANDFPLPWMLRYQLGVYSRQPWHDRQLLTMMYMLFPEEFGFLDMTYFDGTTRRADLVDVVRRDTIDADRKRLYRFIMTVAISSEFFLQQVQAIQQVTSIDVTYDTYVNQVA